MNNVSKELRRQMSLLLAMLMFLAVIGGGALNIRTAYAEEQPAELAEEALPAEEAEEVPVEETAEEPLAAEPAEEAPEEEAAAEEPTVETAETAALTDLAAPVLTSAKALFNNCVRLTWEPAETAGTYYYVYLLDESSGEYVQLGTTTDTFYVHTQLAARRTYTYKVQARYSSLSSELSDPLTAVVTDASALETELGAKGYGELIGLDVSAGSLSVNGINGNAVFTFGSTSANSAKDAISFTGIYNSRSSLTTSMGAKWDHSLNIQLSKSYDENGNEQAIYLKDGSGTLYRFEKTNSGYTAPAGLYATLSYMQGGYNLSFKDGTIYGFDWYGNVTYIGDKTNDYIRFSYDSKYDLTAVTNDYGSSLSFEYDEEGKLICTKASSGNGYYSIYEYAYDSQGRLCGVIRPDGGMELFEYGENGKLSKYYDANQSEAKQAGEEAAANTLEYDTAGRLSCVIDAGEGKAAITYGDGTVTVKRYEDKDNTAVYSTETDAYDSANRLTSRSLNGYLTTYGYNSNNELLKTTDPDGNSTSYTYDSLGNVLTYTDRAGNVTEYTYAEGGIVPITVTERRGSLADRITHSTYNSYDQQTSTYTEGINSKSFTYYNSDHLVSEEITVTGTGATGLTPDQAAALKTDRGAYYITVTAYTYDSKGNVLTTTSGLGTDTVTTSSAYDAKTNLQISSTSNGVTTSYTYDAMGNTTQSVTGEKVESSTYDELGNNLSNTNPMGDTSTTEYNEMSEEVSSTDYASNETETEYGICTFEGSSRRYVLSRTMTGTGTNKTSLTEELTVYDEHGNVMIEGSVWLSKGSEGDTNTVTVQKYATIDGTDKYLLSYTYNTYDNMGRTLTTTDQSGDGTAYSYDLLGNVTMETTTTGSKQARTINTYDCTGQQLSTRTDKYTKNENEEWELTTVGTTTGYTYDISGRVVTETLAKGSNSQVMNTYGYDAVFYNTEDATDTRNNTLISSTTDAEGRTQYRYYDILGQLEFEEKSGISVKYAYDSNGRMISASRYPTAEGIGSSRTVTTRYTYDSYGRQSEIDYGTHKVSYTYDLNDNVLSESRLSSDGTVENTTSYTYDENGNVLTLTRNGETITYGYNENGANTSIAYADVSEEYWYDDAGNLQQTNISYEASPGAYPASYYRKHYYIDGQRTTILEYRNSSYYIFRTYGYDDEGNITVINHGNRNYGWDEQHSIAYDDEGRIVSESVIEGYDTTPATAKSYTYDWSGRLETETVNGVTTAYAYDKVGNILTKTTGDEVTTYTYNTLDQLQRITTGSVIEASYTYDLSGNRASMTSYGNTVSYTYDGQNNLTSTGDAITYTYDAKGERLTKTVGLTTYSYYFDGVNLLFTKKNGELENQYLYDSGEIFGAVDSNDVAYWYCTDVRGSITKIMKGDANASSTTSLDTSYVYNAYGDTTTTAVSGSTFRNDIAYTGAIIDQETGLYYLMSRYYDPSIGQFISEDSYRGDGEAFWHLYKYCDNDPVNRTDRSGEYGQWTASKELLNKYGTYGTGAAMPFVFYKTNYPMSNCIGFALGFNENVIKNNLVIYADKSYKNDQYNVNLWYSATVGYLKAKKRYIRKLTGANSKILPNERRVALRCKLYDVFDMNTDYHYMLQFSNGKWGDKAGNTNNYVSSQSSPYSSWRTGIYNSPIIFFAICKSKYKGGKI